MGEICREDLMVEELLLCTVCSAWEFWQLAVLCINTAVLQDCALTHPFLLSVLKNFVFWIKLLFAPKFGNYLETEA